MAVRDESIATHSESSAAREGLKIVLFRSKKNGDDIIANVFESIAVLFLSIASGDDFKKYGDRFKKSGEGLFASLFGLTFVRHGSIASGERLLVVLFRSIARS